MKAVRAAAGAVGAEGEAAAEKCQSYEEEVAAILEKMCVCVCARARVCKGKVCGGLS